jgi:hypothetical protein
MTDNQDSSQSCRAKKVAVIAVHGISDQKPYASARAIADLLLTQSTESNYVPFNERFIRMKVEPLKAQEKVDIEPMTDWNINLFMFLRWLLPRKLANHIIHLWQLTDERGPYMRRFLTGKPIRADDPFTQPDYVFMRDKIEVFKKNSVYNTICLEGQCTVPAPLLDGMKQTQVHIYEMYWADRIRLGTGFASIFGGLYQLFFRLGSLGQLTVDLMRAEHQVISKSHKFSDFFNIWALYGLTQSLAGRVLSLFLPILNLYLLIVALMSLPGNIPEFYAVLLLILSTVLLGAIFLNYLKQNKSNFWSWLILPLCVGVLVKVVMEEVVTVSLYTFIVFVSYRLLTLEWVAILGILIWFSLLKPYSRYRPGAEFFGIVVGVPLGVLMLFRLFGEAPNSLIGITWVSLHMIELIYLLLLCGWLSFWLLYFSTLVFACFSIISIPGDGRTLAKQAAWTARLSLSLPALLFSLVTIPLWTALVNLSVSILPTEEFYKPLFFLRNYQTAFKAADFSRHLTNFSGSILAVLIIIAAVLVLVLLLWALVPSILAEISPPNPKNPSSKQILEQGLGYWLNNRFKLIFRVADWIICWMIPILFLIATIDTFSLLGGNESSLLVYLFPSLNRTYSFADIILNSPVLLLFSSATILFVFTGRLNQLFVSLRGAIDSVLDVDNYLRLHPRDANPSARIYARYTSLLRYLCSQSTPDGEPYDAIIIVAHSQGTVISADLLRFLKIDPDPVLKDAKAANNIRLFTMGSPIRQLYGYAFPHLYHWAIQDPASTATTLPLSSDAKPSPKELFGVRAWVNTFRSGDYVGRYLWRSNRVADQWMKGKLQEPIQYISEDPDCTRREFCLGEGAHTHYWDQHAPEVAQEIDRLIREACRE